MTGLSFKLFNRPAKRFGMHITKGQYHGSHRLLRLLLCWSLVIALCGCLADWSIAGEVSHLLDGKSYVGKNGERGKKLPEYEDEEIVFRDGMFTSVSCAPYNFRSGPYAAELVNGSIHFSAVTKSPTHGKITWQGIIEGERADVTFVWTKERWFWDIRREYWFRGFLKQ